MCYSLHQIGAHKVHPGAGAGEGADVRVSRSATPEKAAKKSSSKRSKKSKIAPDQQQALEVAVELEDATGQLQREISGLYLDSPSAATFSPQPSVLFKLESPSATDTLAHQNPFVISRRNLTAHPSVADTVDLANDPGSLPNSRPSSPEKASKSSKKHSKKHKDKDRDLDRDLEQDTGKVSSSDASPSKEKSSMEKPTKDKSSKSHKHKSGAGAGAYASSKSPVVLETTQPVVEEKKETVDEMDPTGSMRFAVPSKFARQNPSLLMQQPSRVLQKLVEEQKDATGERK